MTNSVRLYDLSLESITEFDQRHAAMTDALDLAIIGFRNEVAEVGEIRAFHNLADAVNLLMRLGQSGNVTDLLVEAIARLAQQ